MSCLKNVGFGVVGGGGVGGRWVVGGGVEGGGVGVEVGVDGEWWGW